MIVVVAPGQGSQTPGFLEPWLAVPSVAEQVAAHSEAVGIDLAAHGTVSDADTIRDTAIAQPLIVSAGLVSLAALLEGGRRERIAGIAGHSVGEITAAAGAGVLSEPDALVFVRERARAMAAAAAATPTAMSAVLGGDEEALLARLDELGLEPANYNGGGQIVVAGAVDALQALKDEPLRGTRVVPLQVAGAFHTRYMAPARDALAGVAASITPADPTLRLWTNNDGSVVDSGSRFLELLVGQVASPVRWDLCMAAFAEAGVTGLIELAPAGALVGLAKRGLKGLPTLAIKTPDDLDAARAFIDEHAA
ncbi:MULTISPECIES: ACP S-malonyltransferase [unclassified Rathayibacter]|uniref:ACP S-malonyltransferase n=1 Tax=unclassified Rathayibacter TaxID=2609250 RepID=UPI000F4C1087|nr:MULTISPECIES: ACP S-malonyltransferase [unclassified Rathayibacter]MCJ1703566.1 ACP S-malonyltransferase [Rathayibacter sp. VKM Ac-2926]ROP57938.1 [acyl-carrier-protein] S-malonyltransferase [Rathayibacter sp. PhB186]ROS56323.1 [acyl-carrier-protein] S-malonyltransferase [Rathayibacter sp. PhB185]TCL80313.1 [acyl-carrier-protein] S-malonyltransferase [Rathayibacter sp. PhB192]TCM25839.1 [acyl-carrier-protein] S-malonyltransferase [Rathayibacter sp. PhB179]